MNWNSLTAISAIAFGSAIFSLATPVQAYTPPPPVTFYYDCASNNDVNDCGIAEAQFSTTVTPISFDQVMFTFENIGSQAVTMTSIWFEDLLPQTLKSFVGFDVSGLDSGETVKYNMVEGSALKNNQNVSAIQNFEVSFFADPNNPQPKNGINVGESLGIIFQVTDIAVKENDPLHAFYSVIRDMQNETLRVAVKAQDFASGGSETLINEQVPEPLTILGSGMAIAGGVALKRRAAGKTNTNKNKSLVS